MNKPIFAIAYDFDGTLCPGSMQEHSFIKSLGLDKIEFWKNSNSEASALGADRTLMYMRHMVIESQRAGRVLDRNAIRENGKNIELFPGVCSWFHRSSEYANSIGLDLRHFVISSGLKQMIEASPIGDHFESIFACEYLYDEKGVALWPISAVNYTNKTQFLFRINKWALDLSDDLAVNEFIEPDLRPVPFRNMIFIGDGQTDVPCMRTVKANGGASISVYDPASEEAKRVSRKLLEQGRAHAAVPADYSDGSNLQEMVYLTMQKASAEETMRFGLGKNA